MTHQAHGLDDEVVSFDQSIRDFLSAAASGTPVPGGGSVASLTAALGAAMLSMTAQLTTGVKFATVAGQMEALARRMAARIQEFESFAHADAAAFSQYMDAWRMPKSPPEQAEARRAALSAAAERAADVPLALAEACRDVLTEVVAAAETVNPHAVSDLGVAALLLEAAAQSALLTAEINLPAIRDENKRADVTHRIEAILREVTEQRATALRTVRSRIHSL